MECKKNSSVCIRSSNSTCLGDYNYECKTMNSEYLCSVNETICQITANETNVEYNKKHIAEYVQ